MRTARAIAVAPPASDAAAFAGELARYSAIAAGGMLIGLLTAGAAIAGITAFGRLVGFALGLPI